MRVGQLAIDRSRPVLGGGVLGAIRRPLKRNLTTRDDFGDGSRKTDTLPHVYEADLEYVLRTRHEGLAQIEFDHVLVPYCQFHAAQLASR